MENFASIFNPAFKNLSDFDNARYGLCKSVKIGREKNFQIKKNSCESIFQRFLEKICPKRELLPRFLVGFIEQSMNFTCRKDLFRFRHRPQRREFLRGHKHKVIFDFNFAIRDF